MPLNYEIDNKMRSLSPVMDDLAEWHNRAMRRFFYSGQYEGGHRLSRPESFMSWVSAARQDDFYKKQTLDSLQNTYTELQDIADRLVSAADAGGAPDLKLFDSFIDIYDAFILQMRRIERDCMQADFGLDGLSGLRSAKAMYHDLERELERRSRKGKPFSLALAQIDNFDKITAIASEEQMREIMATIGRLILLCIRSFDDAYHSGESEFIMSLKHSDTAGGTAAIARLRGLLQAEKIIVSGKGESFPLTMSYCVAEPLPGDTLDMLLQNMRADLGQHGTGQDTAMEYFEQSPLQRFVRDLKEDKI